MTPLFRHPEPDDRPSTGALVGAAIIAIVVAFLYWLANIMSTPL